MNNKIKIFITFSVILNIFLIGFIAGKLTRHKRPARNVSAIVAQLPENKRALAKRLLAGGGVKDRLEFKKLQNIQHAIIKELKADEFNAENYQKKVNELEAVRAGIKNRYTQAVKEMATNFTAEERRLLLKALSRRHGRRARQGAVVGHRGKGNRE